MVVCNFFTIMALGCQGFCFSISLCLILFKYQLGCFYEAKFGWPQWCMEEQSYSTNVAWDGRTIRNIIG